MRGGRRDVDHAAGDVRAALVDAHDYTAAVVLVGYAHARTYAQRAVRGRESGRTGVLAAGGLAALGTVDRSNARLSFDRNEGEQHPCAAQRGADTQYH